MSYTDATTGITFGFPDGADNWGPATNRSLQRLAYLLAQPVLLQTELNSPPSSPSEGDRYAVGSTPTGLWSSFSHGDIAVWGQTATNSGLGWQRFRPFVGLRAYDRSNNQSIRWNGTSWLSEVGSEVRTQLNFDTASISGTGTPADPWAVIFPPAVETQSDWLQTDTSAGSYIQNVPAGLRNFVSPTPPEPLTGSDTFNYSGTARSGSSHTQRIARFTLNSEMQRMIYLGHYIGAAARVRYRDESSSTTFRLILTASPLSAQSFTQTASTFDDSPFRLIRTRQSGYIGLRSQRAAPTTGEVSIQTYSTSSDNFSCSGTVYYGILGPNVL